MILKGIYLYLNTNDFNRETLSDFSFKTRFICNYIERELKKIKFKSKEFNKICISLSKEPTELARIVSDKALYVELFFDEEEYVRSKQENRLCEYFSKKIIDGASKCLTNFEIPIDVIIKSIEEFRSIGCINEWSFKKRKFKEIEINAELVCKLDSNKFYLRLKLYKKGECILNKTVIETEPDEIIFKNELKDVALIGNELTVINYFDEPIYKVRIDEFD